jgi:hypothetical protein
MWILPGKVLLTLLFFIHPNSGSLSVYCRPRKSKIFASFLSSSSLRHPSQRYKKKQENQEQKTNATRPITLNTLSPLASHPTILIPASVIPNFVFFSRSKSLYSCSLCCFFSSASSLFSLLPLLCVIFLVFCHSDDEEDEELFREDEADFDLDADAEARYG